MECLILGKDEIRNVCGNSGFGWVRESFSHVFLYVRLKFSAVLILSAPSFPHQCTFPVDFHNSSPNFHSLTSQQCHRRSKENSG